VLARALFAATVLLAGCPSKQPEAPRPGHANDAALRIRVAQLEVKRAAGVAELRELATSKDVHARELALRALGRTGGDAAIATLQAALSDAEPRVVIAAATALGVRASLDEETKLDTTKLVALLTHPNRDVRLAVVEALGRAGDEDGQAMLGCADRIPECALALGRHGRRKLRLGEQPRNALVIATSEGEPALRYTATYALAREHEAPADEKALLALAARVTDELPETGAVAIAGLAKRKALSGAGRTSIEAALRHADWRVAVEAARALANADNAGRALVATSLAGKHPHVIHEALRAFAGKPLDAKTTAAVGALTNEPGWTGCLAAAALGGPNAVDAITKCQLPDHLKLPLLAEVTDPTAKRAALRVLLAHDDPRVRGPGLSMLAATWKDSDERTRQAIASTLIAAIGAKNAIVAGTAVEAATSVFENNPGAYAESLAGPIVMRAAAESDPELAAALFGFIEKHKVAAGLEACRAGLGGHGVRATAARKCLRALGETPPPSPNDAPPAPPVDVATVIGHQVTWHLTTNKGEIVIELRPDVAPWAVASVVALTQQEKYDGLELHRVVPNFVAQGGDPTMSGWGGPGYTLPAEPSGAADGPGFVRGGVGMADAGPDSAGSQWFIMHSRAAHLDGRYTWFGSVTRGQEVADALVIGDKVERATVEIK
jgi:cyclophilin family peptidyl-prolyl cis-trans isomerase/HEAT repeat protein